jgi:hypothetical protein
MGSPRSRGFGRISISRAPPTTTELAPQAHSEDIDFVVEAPSISGSAARPRNQVCARFQKLYSQAQPSRVRRNYDSVAWKKRGPAIIALNSNRAKCRR